MVGVPGIASSIFSTVRDAGVNVIMISQASSEHSVCFAVKSTDGPKTGDVLRKRWVRRGGTIRTALRVDVQLYNVPMMFSLRFLSRDPRTAAIKISDPRAAPFLRFKDALAVGAISAIEVIDNCALLAAVGEGMASRRGTAASLFSALASDNINIRCPPTATPPPPPRCSKSDFHPFRPQCTYTS